jgi:NAD(P)-dependent dehydrogenase (short-subunit alcohol dehydrogenase family)
MPAHESQIAGKRLLVTGGSRGIGLAVSRLLAERGAAVIVAARDPEMVRRATRQLPGAGHQALAFDVSDDAAWRAAIETVDAGGPLHGLVAAAGVLGPIGQIGDIDTVELIGAIQVNLLGTLLGLHYAMPRLLRTGGRAVTFSGGGGTSPLPRYDAYAASKAGVVRATENVAAAGELEINAVAPGFVATRMHEGTLAAGPEAAGGSYFERTREQLAAGGFPAREAAELVAFLLSDAARGITGRLISAQWDPWREPDFQARLRSEPDLATLRRIDGQFFAPIGG